jgi:diguanylate cyclase (GGDEF)-like protein
MLVSYTALRLAGRVAASDHRRQGRVWLAAGAIAMGIGIWSMHFIGMLAVSLPIQLAYDVPRTMASLAIAVATSGFALYITSGAHLTVLRLVIAAIFMGAGIAGMHYLGMAAIVIVPAIAYDPILVIVSVLIAATASFVALTMFFRLREGDSSHLRLARFGAATVMGLAISGMHYTGMAAAHFAPGSFCRGGVTFDSAWLATTIGVFTMGLLVMTLITTVYDTHLQSRSRLHASGLEQANLTLQHQATHDALTGLPNRLLFLDRLGQAIAYADRNGHTFAVLGVDLDRFKVINDTLGHAAGDELLIEVARRLSSTVRRIDTVARTGGDEFLLLISDADRGSVAAIASHLCARLDEAFIIHSTNVHASGSIGASLYPGDGADANALITHADEAMYFAKKAGRNTFHFYNADMSVFSQERLALENDLRRALKMRQFEVHYQPKIDIASGHMNSVEALLRWRHPRRGLVGPDDFIPIAEEMGIMFSIGEWVLNEACRQARQWQRDGLPFLRIAVNISPMHFRQSRFLNAVQTALIANDLEPQFLEIELTESSVMDHADSSVAILEELSRMGVIVSIDDFGTGYSSMSYLRRFPIDKLKIDRSFIRDLTTDADAASIVKAIVSLAHSLRLKVVAEGVETAAQLEQLRALGCDQFQGFYKSAAVLPQEIEDSIRALGAATQNNEASMRTQSKLAAFKPRR